LNAEDVHDAIRNGMLQWLVGEVVLSFREEHNGRLWDF